MINEAVVALLKPIAFFIVLMIVMYLVLYLANIPKKHYLLPIAELTQGKIKIGFTN